MSTHDALNHPYFTQPLELSPAEQKRRDEASRALNTSWEAESCENEKTMVEQYSSSVETTTTDSESSPESDDSTEAAELQYLLRENRAFARQLAKPYEVSAHKLIYAWKIKEALSKHETT